MTRQEIPVFKTREENVAYMNATLPIRESFDLIQRDLLIGGRVSSFYYVNGFTSEEDNAEDHGCTSESERRRHAGGYMEVRECMYSVRWSRCHVRF